MKAVKGIYENGQLKLSEPAPEEGPVDVLVVFPENGDDAWERILNDPAPRPALQKFMREVKEEIAQGKATPLDVDQL
jgi:hypothetical protein